MTDRRRLIHRLPDFAMHFHLRPTDFDLMTRREVSEFEVALDQLEAELHRRG